MIESDGQGSMVIVEVNDVFDLGAMHVFQPEAAQSAPVQMSPWYIWR